MVAATAASRRLTRCERVSRLVGEDLAWVITPAIRRNVKGVRSAVATATISASASVWSWIMALPVRSCLIDGEAIVSDDSGLAADPVLAPRRVSDERGICDSGPLMYHARQHLF